MSVIYKKYLFSVKIIKLKHFSVVELRTVFKQSWCYFIILFRLSFM